MDDAGYEAWGTVLASYINAMNGSCDNTSDCLADATLDHENFTFVCFIAVSGGIGGAISTGGCNREGYCEVPD